MNTTTLNQTPETLVANRPLPVAHRNGFVTDRDDSTEILGWWRKKNGRFQSCRVGEGAYGTDSFATKREALKAVLA